MLTFIDESGYPRPTDSTRNPILLGVCIHENDIKPITNQIYIKRFYLRKTRWNKIHKINPWGNNYKKPFKQ